MIIVVWEDANNCINSIISQFTDKFPKEARYYLSQRPSSTELELLSRPPLIFIGWLIITGARTPARLLKQLDDTASQNLIVIRVNNESEYKDAKEKFSGIEVKYFDNHKPPKEDVLNWIRDRLICDEKVAKYLYRYCGCYVRNIVFAVQILERDGRRVDNKLIRQLVNKSQSASMFDITRYILGLPGSDVKRDDIYSTLFKFQHAESWILETLIKELDNYKKVHMMVSDRKLSITNYTSATELMEDRAIREMPKWKLKRIILDYGGVSLERIVMLQGLLRKTGKSNFDLVYIIQLVSLGG